MCRGAFGAPVPSHSRDRVPNGVGPGRPWSTPSRSVAGAGRVRGFTLGRHRLAVDGLTATRPRWCGSPPSLLAGPDVTVQLRAHGEEHRAVVTVVDGGVEIELLDPAYGIAPGQAAVVYDGSRVVGSATIAATQRVPA